MVLTAIAPCARIALLYLFWAGGPGSTTEATGEDSRRVVKRVCRVTAYCDRGTTASGVQSGVGQCAAPADIPFGTKVYIPELKRTLVVTDRTHKRFRHNTVDIFIPSKEACKQFGLNYLTCEFTLPASDSQARRALAK